MVAVRPFTYEAAFPSWEMPPHPREFRKRLIALIDLMNTIGGSQINSVTGLCLAIFADVKKESHQYQLAMMLEKILYWLSKNRREDYFLYRTDAEWIGDIGLTRYKLRQRRAMMDPLITTQNRHNHRRDKIMHYFLNCEELIERIATAYNKPVIFVRSHLMIRIVKNHGFQNTGSNGENHGFQKPRTKSAKSLTEDTPSQKETKTEEKHAVADNNQVSSLGDKKLIHFPEQANATDDSEQVNRLVASGVWRSVARTYAWLPLSKIEEIITVAIKKRDNNDLQNPMPNYIAGALKRCAESIRKEHRHAGSTDTLENFALQQEQQEKSYTSYKGMDYGYNPFEGMDWADFTDDQPADQPDYDVSQLSASEIYGIRTEYEDFVMHGEDDDEIFFWNTGQVAWSLYDKQDRLWASGIATNRTTADEAARQILTDFEKANPRYHDEDFMEYIWKTEKARRETEEKFITRRVESTWKTPTI